MPRKPTPKDATAVARMAAQKARLAEDGGKRTSINLGGAQVRKLDALVQAGVGDDHSSVIRTLIDQAEMPADATAQQSGQLLRNFLAAAD